MEELQHNSEPNPAIELILRDLLRTIKAVCIYPDNNSLPQSLRQALGTRLVDLAEEMGEIRISVDRSTLLFRGEIVRRDKSREDNLAAMFFGAGVTEMVFKRGLTVEGVNRFLTALRNYLNAPTGEEDLSTLLWEAGIEGFSFQTAEDIALAEFDSDFRIQEHFQKSDEQREAAAPGDSGPDYESVFVEDLPEEMTEPFDSDSNGPMAPHTLFGVDIATGEHLHASAAAEAMGLTDLPAQKVPPLNLIVQDEYALVDEESREVVRLLEEDAAFDPYESTAQMLIELIKQEGTLKGLHETALTCEKVLGEFIAQGQLAPAGRLLRNLIQLADRITTEKPRWAERLQAIRVMAGSRDRLLQLAHVLNAHEETSAAELRLYLDNFDWQALSGLTDLLGELEHRPHRETLCRYLVERGRGKEELLARGIYDKRWYVVRNSVMILGHLGHDRALQHLKQVVNHHDRRVRIELVEALKRNENSMALDLLRPLVYDSDEEIHREALVALMHFTGPTAFQVIAEIVYSRSFEHLDPIDQSALLTAYSRHGKENAVAYLSQFILKFNPLRNPVRSFHRSAAFNALEQNPSERAGKFLEQLARSWRPDIRKQAARCLQRRAQVAGGQS